MSTATAAPDTSADSTATVTPDGTTTELSASTTTGQATSQDGTTPAAKTAPSTGTAATEETFFDPNSIPDELKPAYKSMQAAFTKKMQGISKDRQKIDAYTAFERDPIGNMQAMAQKMGYTLTRAEAAAAVQAQGTAQDFNPQSWSEVAEWMQKQIMPKIQQQFAPFVEKVQAQTSQNIERQLDSIDENWRMYEDDMKETLKQHPTLVSDVAKLYRLSVPEEILNSRATQAALRKLESKSQAASVHGTSTSKTQAAPKKATSFQDAVELARRDLATRK